MIGEALSLTGVVSDGSLLLALPIAMAAGLVSFLSPCVLPLAPGYLAYVTGMTGADVAAAQRRKAPGAQRDLTLASVGSGGPGQAGSEAANHPADGSSGPTAAESDEVPAPTGGLSRRGGPVLAGACLFVAGFTVVFVSFGLLFGGLGAWLLENQRIITVFLGMAVVLLGLGYIGLPVLSRTMWWNADRRLRYRPPTGMWGAPLLGVVFGLGWTPCIGPTLAAVQSLAFTQASAARGALLAFAYCVGLGVPFLLIAVGVRWSAGALAWTRTHAVAVQRFGGAMLVTVGMLLVTGTWGAIVIALQSWIGGFATVL